MSTKITKEAVLDNIDFKELSKSCRNEKDLSSLTKQFMKNMIENMLKAELDEHLSYEKYQKAKIDNSRNGNYTKKVRSDAGEIELGIPRDRKSDFTPQIVPKGRTTISGIDDKITSLYARGMSIRDIEKQVKEMYDIDISDTLITRITDKIVPEIKQ